MSVGGSGSTSGTRESSSKDTESAGFKSEQLKLDEKAIAKIIEDVLGSQSGLASIFGGEQTVGLFDSSVAAQASGDLVSNLVGDLAKLTGENITRTEQLDKERSANKSRTNTFSLKGEI